MYRFVDERDAQGRPVRKADYFHGSQRLEVIWTIIPAAILVFIALYQMGTWAEIKFRSCRPQGPAPGGDHRAAVPVGDALPGPRRPAQHPRRPDRGQRPAFRQEQEGIDLSEIVGRAPFVLLAADADQAGRRARPDDPRLVRLPTRPGNTSWSAPSCAAGAITRCAAGSRSTRRKRNSSSGSTTSWPSRTAASSPWRPVLRGGDSDE